jgi:hypothetical protein
MSAPADEALVSRGAPPSAIRWVVPVAILVPWLALLGSWQTALFPLAGQPPEPLVSWQVVVLVIAAVVAIRVVRPGLVTHVVALAATSMGIALLAAQIGSPLANATADYCGDFCWTAIGLRFISFFGWPIALAAGLLVTARRTPDAELASWTRSWAIVTLVAGLAVAVAWWRTILPNG